MIVVTGPARQPLSLSHWGFIFMSGVEAYRTAKAIVEAKKADV